jgi:predicted amidophosphoribosyltransferase
VDAILLLKFEQIDPLGAWFAERLAEVVRGEANAMAADVVVPVPLHRQREKERGYHQVALLSRPLAKRLRLPHESVLLMRTRARPGNAFSLSRRGGSPYVALLPHVQAAKLTIYASYW